VSTKSKNGFFTVSLKVANRNPSNLAYSVSDQCLAIWRKTYPLSLHLCIRTILYIYESQYCDKMV